MLLCLPNPNRPHPQKIERKKNKMNYAVSMKFYFYLSLPFFFLFFSMEHGGWVFYSEKNVIISVSNSEPCVWQMAKRLMQVANAEGLQVKEVKITWSVSCLVAFTFSLQYCCSYSSYYASVIIY